VLTAYDPEVQIISHVVAGFRWLLYNYFEDKEDLLASALLAHVGAVMPATPRLPEPGTGTVAVRCQLASQNGRSLRRASTQADPIGSSEQHKPPPAYQAWHTLSADHRRLRAQH
jgi:AcrR family transcriptional regulator